MADSKYAGLPGIVYDQPDVYETSDLPESEQDYTSGYLPETSDAIEVLHISNEEAYSQFKGKSVDAACVDFSDRISRKKCKGYGSRRIEWEIEGCKEDESVVQRYQRLQCEITQLIDDVQALKDTVPYGDSVVSSVELGKQVEKLQSTLIDLHLEEQLGFDKASVAEPQNIIHGKLLNLVEEFKNTSKDSGQSKKDVPSKNADGSDSIVSYELYYSPEYTKLNQLAQAAALEKRLDKLEAVIGDGSSKISSLSAWTNHKSVVGAIQVLSSRMALLEPSHLDHIEGRLHSIHSRMNAIAEKKSAVEEADKQAKLSELYDLVKKSESASSVLPEVVDRLVSLESLHEEAMQFSRSLKQMNVVQTQLSSALGSNEHLLAEVQVKFNENFEIIQNNLASLNKRIDALQIS